MKTEKHIRKQKHEQSLRDIWDNIQRSNIHEIRVLEREVAENGVEKTLNVHWLKLTRIWKYI